MADDVLQQTTDDSNGPERTFLQRGRKRNETFMQPRNDHDGDVADWRDHEPLDEPPELGVFAEDGKARLVYTGGAGQLEPNRQSSRADQHDDDPVTASSEGKAEMSIERSIQVLQNAIRSAQAKKTVNNMQGISNLGLALSVSKRDQQRYHMWEDMWEMVASTLKMPTEARSEVKLKLLRGFCRDVRIMGRLDIDDEDLEMKLCRRMLLHVAEPHEVIFSQGESTNLAYCLLSGSVQVGVHGRKVRTVSFGECFCLNTLEGESIMPASAVAMEETALLTLSRPAYLECTDALLSNAIQVLSKPAEERTNLDIELVHSVLAGASFFDSLHYCEPQRQVCVCLGVKQVESGVVLFEQDDPGDLFYFVLAGEVSVVIDGEEKVKLGKQQSFGEIALLGETAYERRRRATVIASTPCSFAVMDRADFVPINTMFENSIVEILVKPPNKRTETNLIQLVRK